MDAKAIAFSAKQGLSAFDTLENDDAVWCSICCLLDILKNVASDAVDVEFVSRVEAAIRDKSFPSNGKCLHF